MYLIKTMEKTTGNSNLTTNALSHVICSLYCSLLADIVFGCNLLRTLPQHKSRPLEDFSQHISDCEEGWRVLALLLDSQSVSHFGMLFRDFQAVGGLCMYHRPEKS